MRQVSRSLLRPAAPPACTSRLSLAVKDDGSPCDCGPCALSQAQKGTEGQKRGRSADLGQPSRLALGAG